MLEVINLKRRFPIIVPVLLGIGLLAVLFLGSNMLGRNNQRLGQNGTTQQGRNLIGENMQGANPDTGPNGGNMLGGNRDAGSGNNPPDATGIGATPGPDNNMGLNRMGQQFQQQTGFNGQKADNIRSQLGNIDGVRQINTVVNGNTALVSYSPTDTTRDANATRNMITDRIKQIDNTITNVVVSNSRDISTRIDRLADNIRNNRPMNELNNEFNQLMQNIRPAGQ